jgi:hypothetical protein
MNRKKETWFDGVFLPSLFTACGGANRSLWLTSAQGRVCTDHMKGESRARFVWCHEWRGRHVIFHRAPNGAGQITFGPTEQEQEQYRQIMEERHMEQAVERYKRQLLNRPERAAEIMSRAREQLRRDRDALEMDLADLADGEDIPPDQIEYRREEVRKAAALLHRLEAVS